MGGPQGRSGRVQKISVPSGFNSRTVHPVANNQSRCTNKTFYSSKTFCLFVFRLHNYKKLVLLIKIFITFPASRKLNKASLTVSKEKRYDKHSLYLIRHLETEPCGGRRVSSHALLSSILRGSEYSDTSANEFFS